MRNRVPRGSEGQILVAVMILTFVVGIIGMAFLSLAGGETRASQNHLDSQRAFWLAESGKERALRWMVSQFRPPESDTQIYYDEPGPDGGSYTVDVIVDTTARYQVEKVFMLESTGGYGSCQRRIRERIKMVSFAQYACFTGDEKTPGGFNIWFVSADVIEGPYHTNGTIRIYGTPRFLGEVTSASDHMIGYPNYWVYGPGGWPVGGNNPTFAEGFELSSAEIPLPTQTRDLRADAQAGGLYLAPPSDVELGKQGVGAGVAAPGWLRYKNMGAGPNTWTSVRISSLRIPVVYCMNDLQISGVLDGELTVASRRDIIIADDILYLASDAAGKPLPLCDDLLGLVAENDIIYDFNPPVTNDLKIDGVLMAMDTSITAEDYDNYVIRGTLTIWGGLIQKYRGPVGLVNGMGQIISGYRKDYHYDTRVTGRTPPGFPLTGVYEETEWAESWDNAYPF